MAEDVYIGIGSNLGNRVDACLAGIREIHCFPYTRVTAASSLYETQPVDTTSPLWFINGVVKVKTDLPPLELLNHCLKIEESVGRVRTEPGQPRPLDLDLLLYGQRVATGETLWIPHPRMAARRFVLEPLAEIAEDVVHPLLKKTIGTLLAELDDSHDIRRNRGIDLNLVLPK